MRQTKLRRLAALVLIGGSALLMAASSNWTRKVPAQARDRKNPYAGQADAVAAGRLLFEDHCAKCHGEDATGKRHRPSLRSPGIQNTTDGELAWLLRNGNTWKGMPSWSSLPEPQRWQIIAYLRSLPPDEAHHSRKR